MEIAKADETAGTGKNGGKNKGKYPDNLAQVLCIRYSINFRKKFVLVLFDLSSKINMVYPAFAKELGLLIRPTEVKAQKIDSTTLDTYGMVVANFLVKNKANQLRFFEKTILVANVSPEIVLMMPFRTLNSADVNFLGCELWWRTYTTKEALPTTKRVELVGKKKFAAVAFDLEHEIYVVYIGSVSSDALPSSSPHKLIVYPFHRPQVSGLIAKEALTKVPAKYSNFADIFSLDLASKLLKHIRINNYAIKLVKGYQQPFYGPIYSLEPVELETLKAYIETNLANGFIRPSKSAAGAPILFNQKSDNFLRLYIDNQGFNNLTIKNRYLLPLIGELLDRLGRTKQFTQLDLTSAYYQIRIRKGNK